MENNRLKIDTFEVEDDVCLPKKENSNNYTYQCYVSFCATLIVFASAIHIGWPSPTIPILLASDSPIPMTSDQGSWIVAMAPFGACFSIFITVHLIDKYVLYTLKKRFACVYLLIYLPSNLFLFCINIDRCGRKQILLLIAIPLIINWILVCIADSIIYLIIARLLIGFVYVSSIAVIPIYLAEIASNHIRGAIINFGMIMQKCGILFVYLIGPYVSISTMAYICMTPAILFLFLFVWCPESPYYLVKINKQCLAAKNLSKLRQISLNAIETELNEINASIEKSSPKCLHNKTVGKFTEFFAKTNRNNFMLIAALSAIGHLCGSHAVIAYAETIFDRVGSIYHGSSASIILGITQTIACVISSMFIDRLGRRPLLLGSLMAVGICNLMLAGYFLIGRYYNVDFISPYIVVLIIICNALYTFGLAPVPAIILGEIFPQHLKAPGALVFVLVSSICLMLAYKLFQIVSDNIGSDCSFFVFSIFCFVFWPYFWRNLPETKGKSLLQIQEQLNM